MKRLLTAILFMATVIGIAQSQVLAVDKTDVLKHDKLLVCGIGNLIDTVAINSYWRQGYDINSLGYTASGWVVAMAQGTDYQDQRLYTSVKWPQEWTEMCLAEGYYITALGNDNGQWVVVCTKGVPYSRQVIADGTWNASENVGIRNWIKDHWRDGYAITSLCYNPESGRWTFIMSKTRAFGAQSYLFADNWQTMEEKIKEYWAQGYNITDLSMGPGQILCIMSQKHGDIQYNSGDRALINTPNFRGLLRDYWDQGYHVTRVCNGVLD